MKPTDVKSHEIACKVLNRDPKALPDVSMRPQHQQAAMIADAMLMDIAEAMSFLEEKFKADYSDTEQKKWFPIFDAAKGFAFSRSFFDIWSSYSRVGSRLCYRFRSEKSADHFGKHFNELHKQSFNV